MSEAQAMTLRTGVTDDDALELLRDLVALPSPSGREQAAVGYLVATMQELGFNAYVDECGNAVGSIGNGKPEIVLLGHIDTVPGAIPVRIDDGRLYGRGAVDAKGPLAAFVVAAGRLPRQDFAGRVTVVGCVEEEAPSSRGAHGVVTRPRPDYCIVGEPSGVDTITLGYKGSLRACVHLAQPSGHSAHDRATIAERGADLWQRMRAWAEQENAGRAPVWERLSPALVGILSGGDGLADWCRLDLSIRLPERISTDDAEQRLRELAGDARVEILGAVPAFRGSRSSPLARSLIGALRSEGAAARFVVKTGTSDMNVAGPAWNCPIVAYGPGDSSLDHTPQEHIVLADYLRAIRVLERSLATLLGAS